MKIITQLWWITLNKLSLNSLINTLINAVIKYYKHTVQGDYFNLASVSENSILTILKATQGSKAAGLKNIYGRFLKDEAKILSKPVGNLCNLTITSENF